MDQIQEIKIKDIKVVLNYRVGEGPIERMMQSIKQHGLINAIGVKPIGQGKYELIDGFKRLTACKKLGYETIKAVKRMEVKDRAKHILINLSENWQREDPSFSELGRGIDDLIKEKLTFEQIEVRLGIPLKEIRKVHKTYSALPEKHRQNVKFMGKGAQAKQGEISHTTAAAIAEIKQNLALSPQALDELFAYVKDNNIARDHMRQLALMIKQGLKIEEALEKLKEYHIYTFQIIAPESLVQRLSQEYKCKTSGILFQKIIYGMAPGIPKPSFVNLKDYQEM